MDCISRCSGALECCQSISEEIVAVVHLKCFYISIVVMLWVLICFGSGHKNACIVAMLCYD
jgi:hypothetical protein